MRHDAQLPEESGIPGGRHADLVPTDGLLPDRFEDFTEDLLVATMSVAEPDRRVQRVQRWGRRGDKQHGIDFEGTWSDGATVAWQCKRLDDLTAANVRKFVKDYTFVADEYFIVYSGEASSAARQEVKTHKGWDIIDQRGLTQMLKNLPLQRQRQILDAFWGKKFRRHFVQIPGVDSFLGITEVSERRRTGEDLLNDLGPAVGRVSETALLGAALDRSGDWPRVVIVNGIGGVGKTRLMIDCLETFYAANTVVQVLWLSPGHDLDKDAIDLLPLTPAVIVVDDAHRSSADLAILLNYAAENAGTQLVLGVRGLEAQAIRNEVITIGFRQDQICEITVGRLTLPEGRELVASLADGLSLDFSLSEALARQARDTPFVAVLTLNMIKGGQLRGPLSLDSDLREQVMARYGDILTRGIDAVGAEPLELVLATLSALGTVNADDEEVRSRIFKLAGISRRDYLRLREQLRNRGIVIELNGRARVMPELFADQVLERAASIDRVDTGFVE